MGGALMETPIIRLSEAAKRAIQDAAVGAGGDLLRITVSDRFEYDLRVDARTETDVAVDFGAITILLDAASAQRADGLSIDFVTGPEGSGFTVDNPNQPAGVRQLSARELKAMIDSGRPFELVDVRTEEERAIAKIEGSRLLDADGHRYLLGLDRNTAIVFQCHHGIRSQSAAKYFLREGFRNLCNLQSGIDAWSQVVDSSVPRY
jgi:monothiol glutaredoxin